MESNLVPAMPPLKRAGPCASRAAPSGPSGPSAALRSELTALRWKEGRLDALLQESHSSEVLQPIHSVSDIRVRTQIAPREVHVANMANVSHMANETRSTEAFPLHRSAPSSSALKAAWRDPARSPAISGRFVFDLDLKRFFLAWAAICKDMRAYWRQRRDENSRKWLGSRSKALALWSLFGSLKRHVDQPLPSKPLRGIRVKEKNSQSAGTFFSASEKGICKILLDGQEEVCFRPAEELLEIAALPHPFLAGLAFLAWTLCHAQDEDLKIDGLRTALMFNQIMGKSSGKLTMLAVMQEEVAKGLKFCFNAWKKAMKSKSLRKFRLKKQREIFRAWLEILLMDQHDRALEVLESTQGHLKGVQIALQRRIDQCERVKVKVEKVHLLRLDFFLVLVLQSWQMSCTYRRAQEEGKREARKALALSALQLSESMTKKTSAFVTPHFQAWAARVKHAKKVKGAAEGTISAMLGSSLSLVFNAWKLMKMSDFQMVQAQLQRREREFNELQEISQSFFTFSQENVERLKNMESALQAADRALQIGAARGDSLEVEVQKLQKALKQQAEEAGSRGEKLKEDMERKGHEEMEALAESTAKVKAELQASREMEARLQRLWQGGEGDLQESEAVLELRQRLAQAQHQAETLRSSQQMQAERLRAAEATERRAMAAAQAARQAAHQAEEAAMEAEEMARLEELAAEALEERWNATMQHPVSPLDPASPSSPSGPTGPAPASSLGRPMILGPGISTQTSMPGMDLDVKDTKAEAQQKYKDAWRPRGRNLIDTTNEDLMTFDLATNILSTGAYFKKKAGRRSSVKRYFFIGYAANTTGFLKYFKDHAAAQAGQEARGAFDLMDLVRANWDGTQNSITLTQSTKKDSSERGLTDIPETFFHALLFGVHEAEFRRQYPEYRG